MEKFHNATPPTVIILFQQNVYEYSLWQGSQMLPIGILQFNFF